MPACILLEETLCIAPGSISSVKTSSASVYHSSIILDSSPTETSKAVPCCKYSDTEIASIQARGRCLPIFQ